MDIQYLGHSSFKIKGKNATVVTDPFDPKVVGLKFPTVSADLVTVSHEHDDHNKTSLVSDVHRIFRGPGEYESKDVSVLGFSTYHDDKKGAERGKNTVFLIEIDRVRVVHLGDLGHKLSEKQVDALGEVDVLLLPVGGEYTIGPEVALDVMRAIEPAYTIPMHYQTEGLDKKTFEKLAGVKEFVSAVGTQPETLPKLSIKKEMMGEESQLVILEKK